MDYTQKYLKYKKKYLDLSRKLMNGGVLAKIGDIVYTTAGIEIGRIKSSDGVNWIMEDPTKSVVITEENKSWIIAAGGAGVPAVVAAPVLEPVLDLEFDIKSDSNYKLVLEYIDELMKKKTDKEIPEITFPERFAELNCPVKDFNMGIYTDMGCNPVNIDEKFLKTGILTADYISTYHPSKSHLHIHGNLIENDEMQSCVNKYINGLILMEIFGFSTNNFNLIIPKNDAEEFIYPSYLIDSNLLIKELIFNLQNKIIQDYINDPENVDELGTYFPRNIQKSQIIPYNYIFKNIYGKEDKFNPLQKKYYDFVINFFNDTYDGPPLREIIEPKLKNLYNNIYKLNNIFEDRLLKNLSIAFLRQKIIEEKYLEIFYAEDVADEIFLKRGWLKSYSIRFNTEDAYRKIIIKNRQILNQVLNCLQNMILVIISSKVKLFLKEYLKDLVE